MSTSEEARKDFLSKLDKLCREHGLALVPTYGGAVSFHDRMTVVPYDGMTGDYLRASDTEALYEDTL